MKLEIYKSYKPRNHPGYIIKICGRAGWLVDAPNHGIVSGYLHKLEGEYFRCCDYWYENSGLNTTYSDFDAVEELP